jgi:hypothetical protein
MDEGKQTKPSTDAAKDTSAETAARQDEATSSDTLSDLQQTQIDSTAATSESETSGASGSSPAPAPDGTPDTSRGGSADGRDSGGPM